MKRIRDGERERFAELFDRVAAALFSWASLRIAPKLRRAIAPEDVVQEVWCRALGRFEQFDPSRAGFRSWAFGIARHVLLEAFKSQPRSAPAGGSQEQTRLRPEDYPAEATAVSQRVARDLAVRAFLERVSSLGTEDRELVILRGLQELPHEQVAVHLGIGEDAARKRWARLRERLRAEGPPPELLVP